MVAHVRPQGYFDIVKQVPSNEATEFDKKYGIVLSVKVSPSNEAPSYKVATNTYAQPQIIITIEASTTAQAVEFIDELHSLCGCRRLDGDNDLWLRIGVCCNLI